jgi:3-oxoacyl-[acyl-carrier protein] reductase
MDLKDVKVIITGGTAGIGYETARTLKLQGAMVVICGRDEMAIERAVNELGVYGFKADISREEDVLALFKFAFQAMDGINVLINNAGIGKFSHLVDSSLEDFQHIWEVNVKGMFMAGREAAKYFIKEQYGNIINIGSTASLRGFAQGSAYVSSKFAVAGLTECWRAELRPYNIRVMQINPSEVRTDFIAKAGLPVENADKKLRASEIAHVVMTMLSMNDIGFIPDASVWATRPW